MSASAAILTRTWKVGARKCTLTVPRPRPGDVMHASAEWSPSQPSRLTPDELRQYQAGRNQAIAEIAAELSIKIAVLDV